jgi:signal transduction histidine kinase/ligand-binding sensor domain-containing protein
MRSYEKISVVKRVRQAMLWRLFLLCCVQAIGLAAFSQQNIKFDHLDINSGLSQNHILCILQDSRGFMWFGTRDGLNKYDGYTFTVYKSDKTDSTSISNNFISGIVEDSKGVIWIATRGGGLNRYDKEKDNFIRYKNDPANDNSLSSDLLTNIARDSKDNLWICSEEGLNYFEPAKNRFSHYAGNSKVNGNAQCVLEDSKGNVWVGAFGGGLQLLDKETKTFTVFKHDPTNKTSLADDDVISMFEDSKKNLWIGTRGGGLDLLDRNTGKFRHFRHEANNPNSIPADVVAALGEDRSGNLWIGTENGGLSIYEPIREVFYLYQNDEIDSRSISHNSIYSIYMDTYGSMWVGTFAGGVNIYNKDASRFAHYNHTSSNNSLSNNNVLSMAESSTGKIWIGTDGGGVNLFDPATRNFRHFRHEKNNINSICGDYVLNVCEDSKGNLWIGTWADGITVFNPQHNTYRHFKHDPSLPSSLSSNNAWVIFEDREKNIWVGTYNGGLNLYDPVKNTFTHFDNGSGSMGSKQIQCITDDSKGNLWIGTDGGGLLQLNKQTREFTTYLHKKDSHSISDNRVTYVYEDDKGNLWINTMVGLNYFDTKTKQFTGYYTSDGLPNNVIFGLLEDKDKFWLSTNRGLSCFDPATMKFKNFGVKDGLQSYEFKMRAFCKTRSGMFYFGGINGFNEFLPASIVETAFDPPVVITDFQVFNKKIPIGKNSKNQYALEKHITETREITLPYSSSVISFEFASLSYSNPEKKQYAYMLEGFDKDWNIAGTKRTATYTNLDPGKYVFKVKGMDNEGNWSTRIVTLKLTIIPPFWLTWWFRIAVLLGVGGIIMFFYRRRINFVRSQQQLLEQKVKEQTAQLEKLNEEEHKARLVAEQAQQEIDQVNKDLARKNIELEQFVYIASHDLREPLRTTASFVELFQQQYKGRLDEKADTYLSYITQSADRMKTLINDLLDYSRIGNHKDAERVDCSAILQEVQADLATAISEAGATITADPMPEINAYRTNLKQLFQNLLINAIKFRKKDTAPVIHIGAERKNGNWQFAFTDNGIGVAEKHKEKIFVIFQRLHTRKEYEGSGIGLAFCKKIVELHNGDIWLESELGKGCTFYFTIQNDIS